MSRVFLKRTLTAGKVHSTFPVLKRNVTAGATKDTRKPVMLILGGGSGIGQTVARKFAQEGYHSCVVRRGKGPNRLLKDDGNMDAFVQSITSSGGTAEVFFGDGTDPNFLHETVTHIEENVGPIHCAVYNIGAQIGNRTIAKTSYRIFGLALNMGVTGAFAVAKECSPYMIKRGSGTIILTSSTAAYRGNRGQHAHTAAMGARKNLSQSLNHELGPQGIHVVHVCLDGPVASPETIGLLMPKMYEKMMESKKPNDEMILPENVADTYWYLYSQPRSNWTLDLDIRPWKENPWMNSA